MIKAVIKSVVTTTNKSNFVREEYSTITVTVDGKEHSKRLAEFKDNPDLVKWIFGLTNKFKHVDALPGVWQRLDSIDVFYRTNNMDSIDTLKLIGYDYTYKETVKLCIESLNELLFGDSTTKEDITEIK